MKDCRIKHSDGTYKNAGTDEASWFSIEEARGIANFSNGETIWQFNVAIDPSRPLWEVF